jgi:hypothetical protein
MKIIKFCLIIIEMKVEFERVTSHSVIKEKTLASKWIPYKRQKPPSGKRILVKHEDGSVHDNCFYGFQGEGISGITHWKPNIKYMIWSSPIN